MFVGSLLVSKGASPCWYRSTNFFRYYLLLLLIIISTNIYPHNSTMATLIVTISINYHFYSLRLSHSQLLGDVVDVLVGGVVCLLGAVIFVSSFKIGQALTVIKSQVISYPHLPLSSCHFPLVHFPLPLSFLLPLSRAFPLAQ